MDNTQEGWNSQAGWFGKGKHTEAFGILNVSTRTNKLN